MKKYLIIKCQDIRNYLTSEDWEGTPVAMCNNWEKWYQKNINKIDYTFEVYELNKKSKFKLIKDAYDFIEEGMALYYWESEEDKFKGKMPKVIYKYPNLTLKDKMPKNCLEYYSKGKSLKELQCGYSFSIGESFYCYTIYRDNDYLWG